MTTTLTTLSTLSMSTREIADLTNKRHDHVLRDTRKMLVELHGEGGLPKFGETLTDPQNGQEYLVYQLPKRETLILISGYSITTRAKIVDRWLELEATVAKPLPHALRTLPAPDLELQLEGLEYKHQTRQLKIQTGLSMDRMAQKMSAWIQANHPAGIDVRDLVAEFFAPQDSIAAIRNVLNRLANGGKWQVQAVFHPRGGLARTYYSAEEFQAVIEAKARALADAKPPAPALPPPAPTLAGQRLLVSFNPDGTYRAEPVPTESYVIERGQLVLQMENLAENMGLGLVSREAAKQLRLAALFLEGVR